MDVRLNYLYKDAGNYRICRAVLFRRVGNVSAADAERELEQSLTDGEYFIASHVAVPDLRPADFDSMLDHDWHEVECVEECDDPVDDQWGRRYLCPSAGKSKQ